MTEKNLVIQMNLVVEKNSTIEKNSVIQMSLVVKTANLMIHWKVDAKLLTPSQEEVTLLGHSALQSMHQPISSLSIQCRA